MEIRLGLQSYQARAKQLSAERMVNLFVEKTPEGSKEAFILYGTPGLDSFATIPAGNINNMIAYDDDIYAVGEDWLYKIDSDAVITNVGFVGTSSGRVSMSRNGDYIVIINNDGTGYTYNVLTDTMAKIVDVDFPTATNAIFLGQYTIIGRPDTGQFWWSALNNPTSWDALDFATAEGSPDNLVAVATTNSELWLFGESTTEVWTPTGNADLPFQRIGSAFIGSGLAAKNSVALQDNKLFWLSDDLTVLTHRGYTTQKVSTYAMENEWQSYTTVSDAIGFSYQQEGHEFYILTFPTQKKTWVYDISMGLWHERESDDDGRWWINKIIQIGTSIYGGNYKTGDIYKLNLNTYTDNGTMIKRSNTFPQIWQEGKRITFHRLRLDMQVGQGLEANTDPKIILDWSDDGGMTFKNELSTSIGKVGEYMTRPVFHRLGQSRQRVFRIQFYDPIKICVLGAFVEVGVEA